MCWVFLATTLFVVGGGVGGGPALLASPANPASAQTVRDDRYHYAEFRDGAHDWNYVEWWYFNLVDESQGLELAFTYSVLDPDNLTGFGSAGVLGVAYAPETAFHESIFVGSDRFHGSTTTGDLLIGNTGFVDVIDEGTYRVVGSVAGEHRLAWDLTFVSRSLPWLGTDDEKVGLLPWERMSWLVYMPRASVSGTVWLDDEIYVVHEVRGYHDHNWGEWILTTVIWNWGQFSAPGFDLELGDFRRRPTGTLAVEMGGERIVFDKDRYQVIHTQWDFDAEQGRWFPTETWLLAQNDRFALVTSIRVAQTQALLPPPDIPFLFLKPLLFEQTAHYAGGLWVIEGSAFRLVHVFEGLGFKEFATRTEVR